jgi:hypothetical protein
MVFTQQAMNESKAWFAFVKKREKEPKNKRPQ